ncbi:MAG: hypothetical protein U1F15_07090 [Burkholderiales bacterium]
MSRFVVALLVSLLVGGRAAAADVDARAKADRLFADQMREFAAARTLPPVSPCAIPLPLPAAPRNGLAAGAFDASWSANDAFALTMWREPCGFDPAASILYLRVVPTAGMPFICSSAFAVLQNGTQYDVKLVQAGAGYSFCNEILAPVTLALDQWSFDPGFDRAAAFTLVFKGALANHQGMVSASNGTKVKTLVTLELSATEEANLRGAINAYNADPGLPFMRPSFDERTYARYTSLAVQLGMTPPPPR